MKRIVLLLGILLIGVMLFACAPRVVPMEKPLSPETMALEAQATGEELWKQQWQKLVKAAKQEGNLNLYATWSSEERQAIVESFKKAFDIKTYVSTGKGEDIAEKVITEHRYGLYLADIYIGGPTTQFNVLKPAGVTEPIAPYSFTLI